MGKPTLGVMTGDEAARLETFGQVVVTLEKAKASQARIDALLKTIGVDSSIADLIPHLELASLAAEVVGKDSVSREFHSHLPTTAELYNPHSKLHQIIPQTDSAKLIQIFELLFGPDTELREMENPLVHIQQFRLFAWLMSNAPTTSESSFNILFDATLDNLVNTIGMEGIPIDPEFIEALTEDQRTALESLDISTFLEAGKEAFERALARLNARLDEVEAAEQDAHPVIQFRIRKTRAEVRDEARTRGELAAIISSDTPDTTPVNPKVTLCNMNTIREFLAQSLKWLTDSPEAASR